MRLAMALMMAAAVCGGQTTVNGGRDYKGALKASGTPSTVDFGGAGSTAPVKTGTMAARPGSCTVGQIYFATDAAVGLNLGFCTSSGVWSQMTGGSGGGSGTGVSYCAPGSASGTTYTCSPNPVVSAYAAGVTLAFVPDVAGAGGATTVNVNGLGAKSVKQADGATNPVSTDLVAGRIYILAYDGAAFRLGLNATSDAACAVTVGATPAMNAASCNGSGGSYNTFKLGPLAQNATPTFTNGLPGRTYVIQAYQGAVTARTVTWPGNVTGGCPVSPTLGSRTQLVGTMDSSGSTLLVQSCSYLDDASTIIQGPTRVAPATPAAGYLSCWFDSTANTELCKDSSGNVFAAVKTAASATANQFVTHINAAGVPQTAQPTLSGTTVPANTAADQVVVTSAAATGSWASVPNCGDATHALSYSTSTHTFACQNITAAAGAVSLDSVLAAGGSNSINSADNAQTWKWTLTTSGKTGFRLSENTASAAGGTPILIGIDTLAASTVNPFQVTAAGTANGVRVNTAGALAKIGTGSVVADAHTANSVNSAAMTVVNTRRTCTIVIGADNGAALANLDLGQARWCYVPYAATIVEIIVAGDAGTPNVIVGRNRAGTVANLVSSALATASAGGLACSNTGGTAGLDATTTCLGTLQNTSINAGDWLDLVSGTAGGTAKRMTISVTYTVN